MFLGGNYLLKPWKENIKLLTVARMLEMKADPCSMMMNKVDIFLTIPISRVIK